MAQLAEQPAQLACLEQPALYDPEIVFFFDGVGTDPTGQAHFLLDHPSGAAFYTRYRPEQFAHAARWILINKWRRSCCRLPVNPRAITPRKPKAMCVRWRPEPALHSVSVPGI